MLPLSKTRASTRGRHCCLSLLHPPTPYSSARFLRNALDVLPQALVLGLLPLGFPTPGGAGRLERGELLTLELDVGAGDAVPLHDLGGALVPLGTEQVEADGLEVELFAEALEREVLAVLQVFSESLAVDHGAGLLLENEDVEAVIRRTLLREGRQPGLADGSLDAVADAAQGQNRLRRVPRDVGRQEVAPAREAVVVDVRNVRVDHHHGQEALALVEDLHTQGGRDLGHARVEDGSRRDLVAPEGKLDVHGGLERGKKIRDNVELRDTLRDDLVVHGTPAALGEEAVNGLGHVACIHR